MRRELALFALLSLILAVLGLAACGPAEEDPAPGAEELAWLKENKPVIDAKRAELQEARDLLAAGELPEPEAAAADGGPTEGGPTEGEAAEGEAAEGEAAEGEGEMKPLAEMTAEELEARATVLEDQILTLSNQISEKVVAYLNAAQLTVDGERTPDQQLAIDVKIAEDISVAQEYIDKGGNYSRALEIYHMAQQLDPEHPDLLAAIATAEELRYMTEERFAQVKKKMTKDEVRKLLGQVKHTNVREFPDDDVVGWFYRKEVGGAAGVYFKESRGKMLVYNTDYDAIKQKVIGGDGE